MGQRLTVNSFTLYDSVSTSKDKDRVNEIRRVGRPTHSYSSASLPRSQLTCFRNLPWQHAACDVGDLLAASTHLWLNTRRQRSLPPLARPGKVPPLSTADDSSKSYRRCGCEVTRSHAPRSSERVCRLCPKLPDPYSLSVSHDLRSAAWRFRLKSRPKRSGWGWSVGRLNTEHPSRIIKCSNIHRMWRDNATF
jgi:hypothetical protein